MLIGLGLAVVFVAVVIVAFAPSPQEFRRGRVLTSEVTPEWPPPVTRLRLPGSPRTEYEPDATVTDEED